MTKYGIADIGSNTMVLMIYEMKNGKPEAVYYHSEPVHLINYVSSGRMSDEGISTAYSVLREYDSFLDEMQVSRRYACLTEPGRTDNSGELLSELRKTSFHIIPLTGEDEAECEYLGSQLFYPDIESGTAFDVGGGSSELIAFRSREMISAVSFPFGCICMSRLPGGTDPFPSLLKEKLADNPAFADKCRTLIGIGGTVRAAGVLASALFRTGHALPAAMLKNMLEELSAGNEKYKAAAEQVIEPARRPYLIPGFRLILDICEYFQAETILICETNVREGFLLKYAVRGAGE